MNALLMRCYFHSLARCAYQAADMAHDAVGDYVEDYNERASVLQTCVLDCPG